MDKEAIARLLDEPAEERQKTTEALGQLLAERYGEAPLVLQVLREQRPDLFNAQAWGTLTRRGPLDGRTAELVAISAAAALRDDHSIRAHLSRALALGATPQQVFDVLAISASIAESSIQSVAFREYLRLSEEPRPQVPLAEATLPQAPRRGRGRPRAYADRATFWEEVVQELRRRMPRATVSKGLGGRVRSVRLGRGQQARVEWAFGRGRGFSVRLVLTGSPEENQERLGRLEADRRALERETGARLTFEAGRGRHARVAAPYRGSTRLSEAMRDWAVERMVRFHDTFRARLQG
jgi:AhpD family alkylhydroperoxidase